MQAGVGVDYGYGHTVEPKMEEMTRAKVEQGYASAQRGDLLEPDRVQQEMEQRKSAWIAEQCEQNET